MMSPTSGSASTPGPAERLAAAAGTNHIGTLVGTLANVGVDPAQPEDIGDRRVTFLEFSSAVDFENGEYLYRYSATNHTDLTVPIAWDGAGLSGELLPFSTLERSLSSSLMPTILDSAPAWTLTTNSAFPLVKQGAYGLEVYAPVPEPRLSMLLVAGLALLALRRRQRARHHA